MKIIAEELEEMRMSKIFSFSSTLKCYFTKILTKFDRNTNVFPLCICAMLSSCAIVKEDRLRVLILPANL